MPGASIVQQRATKAEITGPHGTDKHTVFAGCNYLGLAHDPRVLDAVRAASERYGLSTSASRETSGNTPVHEQLERDLVGFIGGGSSDAVGGVLLPDGYTANLAAVQGLTSSHTTAVIDARAHASLSDAARCAGMEVVVYRYADAGDAARALAGVRGGAVVMTDGVFTADGRIAPARELLGALRPGDRLLIDDCHGFGVLASGRGTLAHAGLDLSELADRVVLTTTLAKGLGAGGGIVLADRGLIGRVHEHSHAYICTTPVSPIVAAGALRALEILASEPSRIARLGVNAGLLYEAMDGAAHGPARESGAETPICARPVPDRETGDALASALRDAGLYVPLMAYPGGPAPWYFRASVTSEHTPDEITRLAPFFGAGSGSPPAACAAQEQR